MGKKLIIQGADFSANAVSNLPDGFIELTVENAVTTAKLFFSQPTIFSVGDYDTDMVYWNLSAGSVLKIKGSETQRTSFCLLTQLKTTQGNFSSILAEGFTGRIRLEPGSDMLNYYISSDCVLAVYQGLPPDYDYFPSILIYKP